MKNLTLFIMSAALLWSCHQTKKEEKQSATTEQANDIGNKSVSLTLEPNVFNLAELPDVVKVIMTNGTKDTITTGLHYQIENYQHGAWKEVSAKNIVFEDLGWKLKPTQSETFEKKLYKGQINYQAGKYRIVKYYLNSDYQKTKETHNVYGEFEIK